MRKQMILEMEKMQKIAGIKKEERSVSEKQTAVEWLKDNLPSLFIDDSGHYQKLFDKAIQMERQQLIMFAEDYSQGAHYEKTAENYYKEIYGS